MNVSIYVTWKPFTWEDLVTILSSLPFTESCVKHTILSMAGSVIAPLGTLAEYCGSKNELLTR